MKKIIIMLMLLAGFVNSYTLTFETYNLNNKVPLNNATIVLTNGTDTQTQYTNLNGNTVYTINPVNHQYNITKPGYYPILNTAITTMTDDIYEIHYLTPISQDGIVRIRFNDLTFATDREFAIFYGENNRLEGVYKLNETIQLIVNKEYIIKPMKDKTDILGSPKTFSTYMNRYSGYLYPILMVATLFIIFVMVVSYAWNKK